MADIIIKLCFYWTAIALPLILVSFIVPIRRRQALDRAFIWTWFSFSSVVTFRVFFGNDVVHGWLNIIRPVLWLNVALSECFVLYCIYLERQGRGYLSRAIRSIITKLGAVFSEI